MRTVYLDYAAATPLDRTVLRAMQPYLTDQFYNPSATYLAGRAVRQSLEAARAQVAQSLGAKPAEIIFTAGATEANNLAIQGILKRYPTGEVIVSAIEHESVLEPAKMFNHKITPVNKAGILDIGELKRLVSNKTVLVSVLMGSNEIGSLQPLKDIAQLLRQIRNQRNKTSSKMPIYLHTDAAQSPCYLDIHVSRLGVDLMSLNGGKIYGPKQSGALYIRTGVEPSPLVLGGGQENGLRSGTENVANYIGLAAALSKAEKLRRRETERVAQLRTLFIAGLERIPGAKLNGSGRYSLPHIVNVRFAGQDNERLMMQLDEVGFQVAVGSACSASSQEPSAVLKAIGLSTKEARSSLRFSFGRQTTTKDVDNVLSTLAKMLT